MFWRTLWKSLSLGKPFDEAFNVCNDVPLPAAPAPSTQIAFGGPHSGILQPCLHSARMGCWQEPRLDYVVYSFEIDHRRSCSVGVFPLRDFDEMIHQLEEPKIFEIFQKMTEFSHNDQGIAPQSFIDSTPVRSSHTAHGDAAALECLRPDRHDRGGVF
jgi:hypothetical protein